MKKLVIITALIFTIGLSPAVVSGLTLDLDYSTYLGGSERDMGKGIDLGTDGRIYVTGDTYSSDFPTGNPYQAGFAGSVDAFVTALSSNGSALFYSTYLGGGSSDRGYGISLGTDGRAYVTGSTSSSDFPTENPYQAWSGGSVDVFVTALSSDGSSLFYSTYLGGSSDESGNGIALGTDGRTYVHGFTYSPDFPTENPYQANYGGGSEDSFVSSLSSSGSDLIYSTYLGGSDDDYAGGISLGTDGRTYVTGYTSSSDFPTENPYQAGCGGDLDVYVTVFSPDGSSLVYSTYLGGNDQDFGGGIIAGADGMTSVTGYTYSSDFPTENPYQASHAGGERDAFVCKLTLNPSSSLVFSTYLGGGGGWDQGMGIILGTDGAPYVTGRTASSDFPTVNPYQAGLAGGYDVFMSALSSTGSSLSYSTYLGGSNNDSGYAIKLGTDGKTSITGYTQSSDFPTENPYQAGYGGGTFDAFVSRLVLIATPPPSVTPTPSATLTPAMPPTLTPPPTATPTVAPPTTATPPPSSTPTPSVTPTPTCGPTIDPQRGVIALGDYDGDGTDDIAIFRATSGLWAIRGISRAYFGTSGDLPVPGDYSGDDTSEIAIYRGSTGLWAVRDFSRFYMGSGGIPAPGDYDGDGFCDAGVFTDSSGRWQVRDVTSLFYGQSLDWPIPGDFNEDGTAEIGIFRETTGLWAIRGYTRAYYGHEDDWPVPGDYDGDGIEGIAIWRPCSGLWAERGITRIYYGTCLDWPRPADYDGNGSDDIGIFRETSGLWAVRGITRAYYGSTGDIPVTR